MVTQRTSKLLDREVELDRIDVLIEGARIGRGAALVIEGPAGIGKTALAACTGACARERGIGVFAARGGELERELPFGIVRQLFEVPVARASKAQRSRLVAGPAALAARSLGLRLGDAPLSEPGADDLSIIHGVYWLCSNFADEGPLLIVVDDAHWADPPSLSWLLYLVRRLEHLPLLVVVGTRTAEPGAETRLLDALGTEPLVEVMRPEPLSESAVAALVRDSVRVDPDERFCRACYEASGGNPLFARELIAALVDDEIAPVARYAGRVRELRPDAIVRGVLSRIGRLPESAARLARAVAVLGTNAELRDAAGLADLTAEDAQLVADELAAAGILVADWPLEFVHPVVRSVVYGEIPVGVRSRMHGRAARLVAEHTHQLARCAVHLLSAAPAGDPWVVQALRATAARETAPERKVEYLARALSEPPDGEERSDILLELGEAEVAALDAGAVAHLSEGLAVSEGTARRVRAARALGSALYLCGRYDEALRVVGQAITELRTSDPTPGIAEGELRLGLEADLLFIAQESGRGQSIDAIAMRALVADGSTSGERELLAVLAYTTVFIGGTADEAAELAGLALGGMSGEEMVALRPFYPAVWALEFADRFDAADHWLGRAATEARERGSASGVALASTSRGIIAYRRGSLAEAKAETEAALDLVLEQELGWLTPVAGAILAAVNTEQGALDAASRALERTAPPSPDTQAPGATSTSRATRSSDAVHHLFRGLLRMAEGRPGYAIEDFVLAGQLMAEGGYDHPAYYSWRAPAALARLAIGDRDQAAWLAREDLELARSFGAPRSIGIAQRTLGIIEGGQLGIELLHESVDTLKRSPARLEHARALVDLGAALRRANARSGARERLREGLELADQAGAGLLADRAVEELRSLGVRPARSKVSGLDSLTPSERRVAELAAQGLTNKQIAQRLFLSVKTVEKHLGNTYMKLGVGARTELPIALAALPADQP